MSHRMHAALLLATLVAALPRPALGAGPSRDEMMAAAAAYAEHSWTCREENTVVPASCSQSWESDYDTDDVVVGLPYDWGGYKTLAQFDQDLADGLGAGSHSWHGVLNCTTGLDCSGFVSQVWQCGHYSTSSFHNVSHPVADDEMLPGDAYNAAGHHIVLWVGESDSGQPVFYEATSGTVNRTHLNESATWSQLEGFVAIRSDLLEPPADLRIGTPEEPIEIGSFPFEDQNDTSVAPSDAWDVYGCAPQHEYGPEVVYTFETSDPGRLRVLVTDAVGIDVDVHLLGSADPDDCLARDDTEIEIEALPAGRWFLSADTWTNDEGTEFVGAYTLLVEFFPDVAPLPDAGAWPEDVSEPADVGATDSGGQNAPSPDLAGGAEWTGSEPESDGGAGADLSSWGAELPSRQGSGGGGGCAAAAERNGSRSGSMLPMLLLAVLLWCARGPQGRLGGTRETWGKTR